MKRNDWVPIVVEKDGVRVTIYQHFFRKRTSVTYMVQACHQGKVYRKYRVKIDEAVKEANAMADRLSKGLREVEKLTLEQMEYYRKCEKALGKTPLHVAVAYYVTAHSRPVKKS